MATTLNPYLNFRDTAKAAMTFYQTVFGGELTSSTYGDFQMSEDPAEADKLMHAQLVSPSGFILMGADTPNSMDFTRGSDFSVSLSGTDEDELTGYWEKLSADGTVIEPLTKAPWGDSFGMCVDSFGVKWMVNIGSSPA